MPTPNPARLVRSLTSGPVVRRFDTLEFAALGSLLPNPDPILRATGKQISTYREIARDSHVGACIRRRKAAVKSLQWGVDRGTAPARVAAAVKDMLAGMDMDTAFAHILEAPQFGYSPIEIDWRAGTRGTWAAELIGLPPEWFCFDPECNLRFKSRTAPVGGELLPERKFLVARQDASYANPYGLADLALCYWPKVFMSGGKRFWLEFCEKYGGSFAYGKLPRSAQDEERQAFLADLEAMIRNGVATIPDDGTVEILEAAGKSASADLYERLVLHCRGEISIVQTGTNQTVEASSNKASAYAGQDVAEDLRDADAAIVKATINQLIRWTCDLNWPGADAPVFNMWDQEAKDALQAQRDKSNHDAGARYTRSYWIRSYGYLETDLAPDAAAKPEAPGAGPGAAAVAFAQGVVAALDAGDPDPTAAEQDALAAAAAPAWGSLVDQVGALVMAAPDLATLQRTLTDAYGGLDTDELTKLMSAAFALAELKGMADVAAGS